MSSEVPGVKPARKASNVCAEVCNKSATFVLHFNNLYSVGTSVSSEVAGVKPVQQKQML